MKKVLIFLENAIFTIIVIIALWFMLSFINTIMHNNNDCQYASWSLFNIWEEHRDGE